MGRKIDFVDLSHWQNDAGPIYWDRVAATEGLVGVIAKATDGQSYVDAFFYDNRVGALSAGLSFASYHFLQAGNAAQQMDHYLNVVNPVEGERMVIDYEQTSCRVDDLREAVERLREKRPDVQIAIYGASMLTDDIEACADVSWLAGTSLWAARYSSNPPNVATNAWPTWTAWQYTDDGEIDGITGPVDLNEFHGSTENCRKWFGPTDVPEPEPVPPPSNEPFTTTIQAMGYDITVQIDQVAGVSILVDGEPWHATP